MLIGWAAVQVAVAVAALNAGAPHRASLRAACRARMVTTSLPTASIPGSSSAGDDRAFESDPAAFSAEGLRAYGGVFNTGVDGGTVFVGDAKALAALSGASAKMASTGSQSGTLAAPFAMAADGSEVDPFEEFEQSFNTVCYNELFLWIPRYKEAGFSTFRFEDFIDGRVRRLLPSMRTLVLRAAAPALFGVSHEELAKMLGFEKPMELDRAYSAYASKLRPAKLELSMPSLFDLEGGGDPSRLIAALDALARRGGTSGLVGAGAATGDEMLWQLASSVEQTAALACSMLAAAQLHPAAAKPLAAEQAGALKGMAPDAPITSEVLAAMPMLDAFTRETMRLYPPSRPARLTLTAPLTLPRESSGPIELPAGVTLAPEPFVAHFAIADGAAPPDTFAPARFLEDAAERAPPLLPFGSAGASSGTAAFIGRFGPGTEGAAGARLAVSMAKAVYVQARRMFDETILGASPPPRPSGCPLHAIGERVEVLCKPKMYYELQRGVKQLRF